MKKDPFFAYTGLGSIKLISILVSTSGRGKAMVELDDSSEVFKRGDWISIYRIVKIGRKYIVLADEDGDRIQLEMGEVLHGKEENPFESPSGDIDHATYKDQRRAQ